MTLSLTPRTPGTLTLTGTDRGSLAYDIAGSCFVAASNAPQAVRARADYVCDGTDDQEQINAAIAGMTCGGRVILSEGDFRITTAISMYQDGVWLSGLGTGYPSGAASANYATSPLLSGTRISAISSFSGSFAIDARPTGNVFTTLTGSLTAQAQRDVSGTANNGSGLIRITTSANHPFNTSDRVAVYGVGGTTEANGVWVVTKISATTFDLQGSTFTHAWTSGGNCEKAVDVSVASVAGLPASGEVWVYGSTVGTSVSTIYSYISGTTLKDTYGSPTAVTGARVNYAPRALSGLTFSDFSLDGLAAGSPWLNATGVYMQAFASLIRNVRVQRFQQCGFISDGGGTTTNSADGSGPRGAWDNRYEAVQFRQFGQDCLQLIAGSSDNIVFGGKFAAWGANGIYIQTGSGCDIVGSHLYGATSATGPAIYADARQLVIGTTRIANVGSGGIYIAGLTGQGGGASIANLNIRDCNVLNSGTKDAIRIRASDGASLYGLTMSNIEFQSTDDAKRPRYLINLDDTADDGTAATGTGVFYDEVIRGISWGFQNAATSAYTTGVVRVGRPGVAHVRPQIEQPQKGTTQVLTDASPVTVDAQAGDYCTLSTNTARTISAPTNLIPGTELVFEITNNGGSAAISWDAAYHLNQIWANPGNGTRATIRFRSTDGSTLTEVARSPMPSGRYGVAQQARGLISESVLAGTCTSNAIPATASANGALSASLVGLRAGDVITNLIVHVVTVGTGLTFVKLGLFDKNGTFLRATAECSTSGGFNSATGYKVIPLSSPYTITADDGYYVGYLQWGSGATGAALLRGGTSAASLGTKIGTGARLSANVLTQTDISGNVTFADAANCWWFAVN